MVLNFFRTLITATPDPFSDEYDDESDYDHQEEPPIIH